ncbi:HemK2/MTQ2 family protein methyltransferase [candidate division KSB1 bacterium]
MNLLDLKNKDLIKSCKPVLASFYKNHKKEYIKLFFKEEDISAPVEGFDLLVKVKILEKKAGKYRAIRQIFPLSGKFICTDFLISKYRKKGDVYLRGEDDVWSILPDETPIMAKTTIAKKGDVVLDLATGSGMIAIFCADKAKKVYATDMSPKAVNYAKFNTILNNVENKVEVRRGDLFEPVKNLKFDLIIWNGPTVSLPNVPKKYPRYAFGGPDGADFTRRFIDEVEKYMKPEGKLQWYDCSAGPKLYGASIKHMLNSFKDKPFNISVNYLTTSPISIKKSLKVFEEKCLKGDKITPISIRPITLKEEKDWVDWLDKMGYKFFHISVVIVNKSKKFNFKVKFPKKDIRDDRYLTRYWLFLSYKKIVSLFDKCEKYSKSSLGF